MSRTTRIAVLVGALAVVVLAFVLLQPSDDEKQAAAPVTTATIARTATTPAGTVTTTETVVRAPRPDPGPLLTARKVTEFSVDSGDTVRFRVRSDEDEEVHVHGYDILRTVPAGKTVRVRFKARIEGRFEIELERSATPIGELSVEP